MSRWHRTEFELLPERAFRTGEKGRLRTLEGGGGGGDNTAQVYATMAQAQVTQEQLNWAKEIYASEAPMREAGQRLADDVSRAQLEQMRTQTGIAQKAQEDYDNLYRPLEQGLVKDAQEYDTPAKREAASKQAIASVEQQLGAQRGATMREMERAGVNPASTKTAAIQASLDLNSAKAKAGASHTAAQQVETQGYARRMDAASLGRNIASSQGTSAALASQMGGAAVGSTGQGMAMAQSGQGLMQNAYGTAINGWGSVANSFGNIAAAKGGGGDGLAAGVGAATTIAAVAI